MLTIFRIKSKWISASNNHALIYITPLLLMSCSYWSLVFNVILTEYLVETTAPVYNHGKSTNELTSSFNDLFFLPVSSFDLYIWTSMKIEMILCLCKNLAGMKVLLTWLHHTVWTCLRKNKVCCFFCFVFFYNKCDACICPFLHRFQLLYGHLLFCF